MVRPCLLFLLGAALLTACSPAPARDPAVVQDVLDYVARIKQWEPVEAETLRAIHDVRQSQYVDDDYVVATLGNVMDDVDLHLEAITRYQPRTVAVRKVHERYVTAWSDLRDSFAAIIHAMERKDYLALSEGTNAMQRSREELVTVAAALNLLLKDTGLKEEDQGATAS